MGPPTKNLNGGIIFSSAPPPSSNTIPILGLATRTPNRVAFCDSSSQSLQTLARKSFAASCSSVSTVSPWSPYIPEAEAEIKTDGLFSAFSIASTKERVESILLSYIRFFTSSFQR